MGCGSWDGAGDASGAGTRVNLKHLRQHGPRARLSGRSHYMYPCLNAEATLVTFNGSYAPAPAQRVVLLYVLLGGSLVFNE